MKHGASNSAERNGKPKRSYSIWSGMLARCTYPNNGAFKHYGGRGITVCDRWRDYRNFLADMGEPPPKLSIDRIDVNGNYEPGNCRWATASEQQKNKRGVIYVRYYPDWSNPAVAWP